MWFDPTAIVQPSQPLATFATLATFAQNTVNGAPRVAEIAEVATPPYRWLIHFADRNPLEVCFSPELTHGQVLAFYPDALAAEPIEQGRMQPDTLLAAIGETDQATGGELTRNDGITKDRALSEHANATSPF